VRRVIRGTGKTLIATGVLILLFVVYELWGTGFAERRAQANIRGQFAKELPTEATDPATPAQPVSAPIVGEAVALIKIPKIGVDKAIVEGVGVADLKKGPGHYPGTPLPGEKGNAAIAGHRTTYGAPFYRLNELANDDEILVTTRASKTPFRYVVVRSEIVSPDKVSVLDPSEENILTLTTCHPRFSASQRLIIVAKLVGTVVEPPPQAKPPVSVPRPDIAGLSGDNTARGPTLAWGSLAGSIWLGAWYLGRLWKRRWTTYALFLPVFLFVLFVFFENVSRILPANV